MPLNVRLVPAVASSSCVMDRVFDGHVNVLVEKGSFVEFAAVEELI